MERVTPHRRGRRGQLLTIAPAFVIALCGIAVLCVDVGHFCASKSVLQNTADAGALATVLELWEQRANADSSDESSNRNAALNEGTAVCQINTSRASSLVEFGVWSGSSFSPAAHSVAVNAVRLTAMRNESSPGGPVASLFAGALGINSLEQDGIAVARFEHPALTPFAVDEDSLVPPGQTLSMYDDTEVAPGNCGLLDFDGGENSANDIKTWTRYGYPGAVFIDPAVGSLDMPGAPGLQSSIMSALDYHIAEADTIVVCIYRSVTGTGAGSNYELVGYAALTVTGYTTSEDGEEVVSVDATVVGTYFVDSGDTQGVLSGFMLLQLVE